MAGTGPDGPPQEHGTDDTGHYPALVARLRAAGLDPGVEQLRDALWLARWARPPAAPPQPEEASGGTRADAPLPAPAPPRAATPHPAPPPSGGRPGPPAAGADRIALHPVPRPGPPDASDGGGTGRGRALAFGVPAAPVFPAPLELQRALRPLRRYRPAAPPMRRTLDETATAELSARAGGLVIPVFRGEARGEAVLQCVMDASSSMLVWCRMFDELLQIFGQLGAFRDVRARYLHQGPDGAAAVSRSPDPAAAPLHSADRLSDPTGRRLTVLVSDCAGPLWHTGRAHRLLHHLAAQAPAAVLQPLPQRMWGRTRLPVTRGALSRGDGPGGAAVLKVVEHPGTAPATHPGALAVPVLPPVAGALAAWARLLSGTGAGRTFGAVGWVRADQPPAAARRAGTEPSPSRLVDRFRATASPAAGQLAVHLAAAPLHLPVMQLVQRTMLPHSGPSELAEVLLSGLLTRSGTGTAHDDQWYAFVPGAQEALLGSLGRDDALLVLKHCSQYIERRFGRGGPNFPALALAQLGEGGHPPLPGAGEGDEGDPEKDGPQVPRPFAEVAVRVLERFMPLPGEFAARTGPGGHPVPGGPTGTAEEDARELLRRFESDGMVQYLIDAVRLLRDAVDGEESGPWAPYARAALRLWEVRGGAELLAEAERAAERAAAPPAAPHERAVLAEVLHAAADDRRRRGDRPGALELLRRADREYTAACAAPGLEPAEALRLTLERVRALEAQWRLDGDTAPLQSACGMLEAFVDGRPDRADPPTALLLAHGRTLLRLAGATADTARSRAHAAQAARSLRTAYERGGSGHTTGTAPRVLLDLVDALLASGAPPDEAAALVDRALATEGEERQRAALRIRAGRIHAARYEDTGDPAGLTAAAEWFGRAARDVPRDSRAYADLLAEWGATLLRRAALPDGRPHIGAAIRVLRDCRAETAAGGVHLAERLLLLGRALMLRHRATDDRVDLREAEHLFGLAAGEAATPLTRARCWLELGRAHLDAARVLDRPARLDEAAEAFRSAAEAAGTAQEKPGSNQLLEEAIELSATAGHWRGMTYERAGRPRAARDAYRAALRAWRELPDGGGTAGAATAARLAELDR
ncbi:SAV_2336 N-terminal domain-related protein [Streptomyces sp. NPDC059913]|uniref:SAV_2336 N-terminal domain-related protein n=1 Tax=unclassified Streptomyces TaxID=2593676 RepID=UPI0036577335